MFTNSGLRDQDQAGIADEDRVLMKRHRPIRGEAGNLATRKAIVQQKRDIAVPQRCKDRQQSRITGIRLWIGAQRALGSPVMMVKLFTVSPFAGSRQRSQRGSHLAAPERERRRLASRHVVPLVVSAAASPQVVN
jgi:hypothetical protein